MAFSIRLLGTPQVSLDGSWRALPTNQLTLLATYLAVQDGRVGRDELLALFWPDDSEKKARHNLRQLAYQARKADWFAGLEADKIALRWPVDTDVGAFREALAEGDWARACALYAGDLLDGSFRGASARYEEWLALERDALQSAWREAALNHAADLEAEGAFAEAADLLQDVLKRDPLAEDALRAYLRAARGAGRRRGSLRTRPPLRLRRCVFRQPPAPGVGRGVLLRHPEPGAVTDGGRSGAGLRAARRPTPPPLPAP